MASGAYTTGRTLALLRYRGLAKYPYRSAAYSGVFRGGYLGLFRGYSGGGIPKYLPRLLPQECPVEAPRHVGFRKVDQRQRTVVVAYGGRPLVAYPRCSLSSMVGIAEYPQEALGLPLWVCNRTGYIHPSQNASEAHHGLPVAS